MRILLLTLLLTVLLVRVFEDGFIYFPTRCTEADLAALSEGLLPVEHVRLETEDGVTLSGLLAAGKDAEITLLYFHGNAGNLLDRVDWVMLLASLPADVLVIDYRGYGLSEGEPSEEGLYLDAEAAYRYLTEGKGVSPDRLVIYGKSLGGAPACHLASRVPCAGVILQSTFTSAPDMAGVMMPWFPAKWFIRTRFDNLAKIAGITAPKLIVHSRADEMVPFRMAGRLFEAAPAPKAFAPFDGSKHNDLVHEQSDQLLAAFREFIRRAGE